MVERADDDSVHPAERDALGIGAAPDQYDPAVREPRHGLVDRGERILSGPGRSGLPRQAHEQSVRGRRGGAARRRCAAQDQERRRSIKEATPATLRRRLTARAPPIG